MIKCNKWTLGLAAVGLVTIPVAMQAQEAKCVGASDITRQNSLNRLFMKFAGNGRKEGCFCENWRLNTACLQEGLTP